MPLAIGLAAPPLPELRPRLECQATSAERRRLHVSRWSPASGQRSRGSEEIEGALRYPSIVAWWVGEKMYGGRKGRSCMRGACTDAAKHGAKQCRLSARTGGPTCFGAAAVSAVAGSSGG